MNSCKVFALNSMLLRNKDSIPFVKKILDDVSSEGQLLKLLRKYEDKQLDLKAKIKHIKK